ncbi:MAG: glycosyltransferase family 2 protein [Acidobacteriaceae bacterium]
MDLSVIIVNYNTRELLKKCLESAFLSKTAFAFEVIVSDNGSKDASLEMVNTEFPQVKIIANGANLGFSKGNNVAIRQAAGEYILLLNSDTTVREDTFDLSVNYAKTHPEVGALGCKVLLPSGQLDKACRRKFPNPWNSFLRLFGLKKFSDYNIDLPIDQETEVDAVMGAYMLVPKKVVEKVGMLSEDYFMYGEDLDWCWRIKKAGYKIVYYPKASITHFKYGSSKLVPFKTIRLAHNAMKIFYKKHYSENYPQAFNWLVVLGIDLRMFLVLAVNLIRKNKSVH